MAQYNERVLLLIIRYVPIFFIIILSIIVTLILEYSNQKRIEQSILETKSFYTKFHNEEIKEEVQKAYNYIENEKNNTLNELKKHIKERVYEAHSIATRIYEDNKDTKTKQEILELIKTALGSIIYNEGRGYFFIDSAEGIGLLQPLNRELENKDKLEFRDAKGYQFVKTIVKTIKEKSERYDTYYWYKGGDRTKSYQKISFYKYFEPLNFAIGTGDYVKDFTLEMKLKILEYINSIKLKNKGFIFILNDKGTVLSHIDKKLIGNNFYDIKDENNLSFVQEIIKTAKNGGGYTSYHFSPFEEKAYKKISYVDYFEEWNWVIGTGYHDKDLKVLINQKVKALKEKYDEEFTLILLTSLVITLTLIVLSQIISKVLQKHFNQYKNRIEREVLEFKNLFENTNIGLSIMNTKGEYLRVNKKFSQMLGYEKNELLNKKWQDITDEKNLKKDAHYFNECLEGKLEKYNLEKIYLRKDGTTFDAYLTVDTFKVKGKIEYFLSSVVDISEIKNKDKLIFQQSKMAAMGEMIANIAHQWRQPLSAISAAASGLRIQKELGLLNNDTVDESLDGILRSTDYLSHTIEDFRDFFKPEKIKNTFEISSLIDKSLSLTQSKIKTMELEVLKDISTGEVMTYENGLVQVLINIINNACDTLSQIKMPRLLSIKSIIKEDVVEIIILDNAGGVPEELQGRIFEPYFTTKHKSQGTGIGLYMVNEIMKKHIQGSVELENITFEHENNTYTGAQFRIIIPKEEN